MTSVHRTLSAAFLLLVSTPLEGAQPPPLSSEDKVQVLELSAQANAITRNLLQLQIQVNEAVKIGEEQRAERGKLLEKLRALQADLGEKYKAEIIREIPEDEVLSVYRQGEWKDLCRGPHVPSTGRLGAFKLLSVAGAYWRGDERNEMLQRIYGTSWSSKKDLETHLNRLEEARARDHRKLGKELELFMFSKFAPAMPIFLPKGATIYNELIRFIQEFYRRDGYDEVITPLILEAECRLETIPRPDSCFARNDTASPYFLQ